MADPVGVAIAFTAAWNVASPSWTRIDTLSGCRVRGWQIDRGRPDEFSKTDTGTATVRIVDRDGLFDPTNATSPYYANLLPGKQAAICLRNPVSDTWHTLFRGFVETWTYQLDQTRQYMEVELHLVDGFAVLSRWELRAGVAGVVPLPSGVDDGSVFYDADAGSVGSDRILDVIGDTDWPAGLIDVFTGNVRCGPKVYQGANALEAIQDAADAEFPGVAQVFMSKDGKITFRGRQARFRPLVAAYGIQRRDVADPDYLTTTDVVPVSGLEWVHGADNIYNSCTATPEWVDTGTGYRRLDPDTDDTTSNTVTDATSVTAYGLRQISFDYLDTIEGIADSSTSLVETAKFATYYVENFKEARPRISRMIFNTRRPGAENGTALWLHMCNCEISDLLTLHTLHPGGGGFAESFYVEGIHYQARPGPPEYPVIQLTLDVSPQANYDTNPFDTDLDPE